MSTPENPDNPIQPQPPQQPDVASAARDRLDAQRQQAATDVRNVRYPSPPRDLPWVRVADNDLLINTAQNIVLSNDRVAQSVSDLRTYLERHDSDVQKAATITKQAQTVPGSGESRHGLPSIDAATLTDAQRIRALRQAGSLSRLPFEAQIGTLRSLNIGEQDKEGNLIVSGQKLTAENLKESIDRIRGKIKEPPTEEMAQLSKNIEQGIMRAAQGQRDTVAERIQSRGLEFWDLANPANLLHNVAGLVSGHHMPGRRAMPQIRPVVPGAITAEGEGGFAEGAASGLGLRSASGAVERMMARGGAGGALARLGLGAIPGIGEFAIGAMALMTAGQHIPIVRNLLQGRQDVVRMENLGALTGEGRGAGLAAMVEARNLRGGILSPIHGLLHPFDPITQQIATEIVTSVRTQGFTGRQGRAFERQVASIYRDLRIPVDQATQLLTDAVRQGGESLQQAAKELHGFDDAAHSLSMNINEYTQTIQTAATTLRAGGAGPQATQLSQALVAGLPRIMRNPEGVQTVLQGMQQAAPMITGITGLPPWLQGGPNQGQSMRAFEQVLQQEWNMMPGTSDFEKAANAVRSMPAFQGFTIQQAIAMMRQIRSGRGPGATEDINQTRNRYNQRLSRAITRAGGNAVERMSSLEIQSRGHDWAVSHGISEAQWEQISRDAQHGLRGPTFGHRTYNVHMDDLSKLPTAQLAQIRSQTIREVASHLTKTQERELQKHLRDRSYSFNTKLEQFMNKSGPGGGRSVTANGVRLDLTDRAAKLVRFRGGTNKEPAYRGESQMNQSFPTEGSRLGLDMGF